MERYGPDSRATRYRGRRAVIPPSVGGKAGCHGILAGVPAPPESLTLTVYTAHGCCLCDDAREILDRLASELALDVDWVHIDGDPELEAAWRTQIPVGVLAERKVFKYRVDEALLRRRVSTLRRATPSKEPHGDG